MTLQEEAGAGVVEEVLGTNRMLGMISLIRMLGLETTRITKLSRLWYFRGFWHVLILFRLTTRFLVGEWMVGDLLFMALILL